MHPSFISFFFFINTATTEIYTLSLHDALPISLFNSFHMSKHHGSTGGDIQLMRLVHDSQPFVSATFTLADEATRSEEHTSELQSRQYLVCRLLLEKKKALASDAFLEGLPSARF